MCFPLQTGAGKTFTMIGDTRNFKFRGIAPRAVAQVFANIAEHPEKDYQVSVSYMEIYNERCVVQVSLAARVVTIATPLAVCCC